MDVSKCSSSLKEITGRTYGRVFACERVMRIVDRPGRSAALSASV